MDYLSLLLLPPPPAEDSFDNLRLTYGTSLTQVLTELSQISSVEPNIQQKDVHLSIAIASNMKSFARLQKLFGLMYRLVCVISTEKRIDMQFDNDIDVRIMLVDYADVGQNPDSSSGAEPNFMTLAQLAQSQRSWDRVVFIDSIAGERMFKYFLRHYAGFSIESGRGFTCSKVSKPTIRMENDITSPRSDDQWTHHRSVAVGGTFDHLHAGHKLLLTMTALVLEPINRSDSSEGRYLTIGITGDDLLKNKKYVEELETWEQRQGFVKIFLLEFLSFLAPQNILKTSTTLTNSDERGREVRDTLESGLQIRYKEIFDAFGPTITDPQITALVVSIETRAGGKAVNDKRTEKGWQALEIFEVDVVDAYEDGDGGKEAKDGFESKISSTEIRARIRRRKESANAEG